MKKNISISIISAIITSVFLYFFATAFGQSSNTYDLEINITEKMDSGVMRYDLHVGDGTTYLFWGKDQFDNFANTIDSQDDEKIKFVKQIIKEEIAKKKNNIEAVIDDLKSGKKTYTVTPSTIGFINKKVIKDNVEKDESNVSDVLIASTTINNDFNSGIVNNIVGTSSSNIVTEESVESNTQSIQEINENTSIAVPEITTENPSAPEVVPENTTENPITPEVVPENTTAPEVVPESVSIPETSSETTTPVNE